MREFSFAELREIARAEGLPEDALDLAAAIAMAESGGGEARGHPTLDPHAHQDSNGRWSIGLWQINSLTGEAPGEGRDGFSNDDLARASANAQVMAGLSNLGKNWRPWGAFTNGSFKRFLPASSTPPQAASSGPRPFPGVFLRFGSAGEHVCAIQERLRALGHSIGRVPGCPFGPQTEAAVIAFQTARGLEVDGVVGGETWGALFE